MYSKEYLKNLEIVRNKLNSRALLGALTEEAAELSEAALELIRAKGLSSNPTPISDEEAEAELLAEIADVINCINAFDLPNKYGGLIDELSIRKSQYHAMVAGIIKFAEGVAVCEGLIYNRY